MDTDAKSRQSKQTTESFKHKNFSSIGRLREESSRSTDSQQDFGPTAQRLSAEKGTVRHILFPFVVVAIGVASALFLAETKPQPQILPATIAPPKAQILSLATITTKIPIESYGFVHPRTTFPLIAEVAGRVTWVAPDLLVGSILKKGNIIARIDETEYAIEVMQTKAKLEKARLELIKVKAQANLMQYERMLLQEKKLPQEKPSTSIVRGEAEIAAARATMVAADASYKLAKLNLDRTVIRSPFDARVRKRQIDVGLYVDKLSPIIELYSIDVARVRFAISLSQLELLDLPPLPDGNTYIPVTVIPQPEKPECSWTGALVATEGEVELNGQTIYGIVDIEYPYRTPSSNCLPLFGGSFVRVILESPTYKNVFRVPSQALFDGNHIFAVNDNNRLVSKKTRVVYDDGENAIIDYGLEPGVRIVTSMTTLPVPGMLVSPIVLQEDQ